MREIKKHDIDNGGLLEVYRENFALGDLSKAAAKAILRDKDKPIYQHLSGCLLEENAVKLLID